RRAAKRMHRLINDLLDFESIESGRLRIKAQPEDPKSIIAEAVESLDALAKERKHRLLFDVEPDVPLVNCDRERIVQVISNLGGNAIKVMAKGGAVRIRARASG